MIETSVPEAKKLCTSILNIFRKSVRRPEEVCEDLSNLIGKRVRTVSAFYSPTISAFRIVIRCIGHTKIEYTITDELISDFEADNIRDAMDGFYVTMPAPQYKHRGN